MPADVSRGGEQVRTAEVIAALSLATDLGTWLPFEHGLHSTLAAVRLCERLGVDTEIASQAYYACLLFYVGCIVDADVVSELFPDEQAGLAVHFTPVMFGSQTEMMRGMMRAMARPGSPPPVRALGVARRLPRAVRGHGDHLVALCEVGRMLTDRLGLPASVSSLFAGLAERWDGRGEPHGARGEEIPLPVRIIHVARDATFQSLLGGTERAASVIRERAGHAFDPQVAACLAENAAEILPFDGDRSTWEEALACEPGPHLTLTGEAIDRALAAIGDFGDLISPYLAGHSGGVAELASAAATRCRLDADGVTAVRRAALVHDVGRVAVPTRTWQKPGPLSADEWEQVRLHPYQTGRVFSPSPFLAALAPVACAHHERLDRSGYHRGCGAGELGLPARLLAAADAYHAMTEPRPHRAALAPERAAEELGTEANAGRLDAAVVTAVVEVAGQVSPRLERPAGLTEREAEVIDALARGLQTKQAARALGISVKTTDTHIQNAYRKIGVSTRAAAALFAMEHGLVPSGELPMATTRARV